MTDHLTLSLYNFAHFLIAIVKSLTAIALVWYQAAHAQLLVPVLNVPATKTLIRYSPCSQTTPDDLVFLGLDSEAR